MFQNNKVLQFITVQSPRLSSSLIEFQISETLIEN